MKHVDRWRKSSYSGNQTNRVEVGSTGDGAVIRDTKDRAGRYFTATPAQWHAFMEAIKSDRFEAR